MTQELCTPYKTMNPLLPHGYGTAGSTFALVDNEIDSTVIFDYAREYYMSTMILFYR